WLMGEPLNNPTLDQNLGQLMIECLRTLPKEKIRNEPSELTLITNYLDYIMKQILHDPDAHIVEWPNTGLHESKARKPKGRAKQPDFSVSIIDQLQKSGVLFVGEVSPPSEIKDVYKNCNDLIRIGIFMKDCLDSTIEKGADLTVLDFNVSVSYTIDFYTMNLVSEGIYVMNNIGRVRIPASLKDLSAFVDDMETLLAVREIFQCSET
ncbi:5897_t:CDS:2, partial [Paraglomus occultum]